MSKQKHIFATRSDLEPGLSLIDSQRQLKYVALCLYSATSRGTFIVVPHKSPEFESYTSLLGVDRLGINLTGQHVTGEDYLVLDSGKELEIEAVPQRKGGVHYFAGQLLNPSSICFAPGGLYQNQCLISGRIATISEDLESIKLYREFTRAVTKGFNKVGNYYVGPEALRLLDQGMRLITMGMDEPIEYDLKR
jgi:hypothetical protein